MPRRPPLQAQIRQLEKIQQRLEKKCQRLEEENRRLKLALQEYRNKIFKKNASGVTDSKDRPAPKKRGAPVGHPGTTRKKPAKIDRRVKVTLEKCPCCGSPHLTPCRRTEDHLQEDLVFPRVEVTCFRHLFYYCKGCGEVVCGKGPGELPGSYIGPVAKSIAAFLHYQMKVPYRKIRTFFKEVFHLDFVPSSAPGFDRQIRVRGDPIYETMKGSLPKQPVVHVDETGWRNDGINHWLWCFAADKTVVYWIDRSRGAQVVTSLLGLNYGGVLISDFLAAYNRIRSHKQRCLVHLLRLIKKWQIYFRDRPKISRYFQKLKGLTKGIIALNRTLLQKMPAHFTLRRADLVARLRALLSLTVGHPQADRFRCKLLARVQELVTCLDFKNVSAHNNRVERILRDNVILRKITFGNRSQNGTRNHAVLMSLIATARENQLNPLDFLRQILTRPEMAAAAIHHPLTSRG